MKNLHGSHVPPRRILITGASGGIGAALARLHAAPGQTLMLWGRNTERLEQAAAACRARGATVLTRAIELADGAAAVAALREDDAQTPFDLVILGAGLSDMKRAVDLVERAEAVLELGIVNYATPSALAAAAAERMVTRGGGAIALIGSVSAWFDLPFAAGYGGSKAGLARFAGSARIAWGKLNVRVTLIQPGFVDTAMSQRIIGPRPLLVSTEDAARKITRAIARGDACLAFPWPFQILRLVHMLVPRPLREIILGRIEADQRPR